MENSIVTMDLMKVVVVQMPAQEDATPVLKTATILPLDQLALATSVFN